MKVKDMPYGAILWSSEPDDEDEYDVLGIMGVTLDEEYYEKECRKISGNPYDYELVEERHDKR